MTGKKKIFWAAKKPSNKGEIQGILFPNGNIALGDDAWRMLDKHDCTSHPVMWFNNIVELKRKYNIVSIRKGHYYMPAEEKETTNGQLLHEYGDCGWN